MATADGSEVVEGRRLEVAQHGPGAGGQNRRHPAAAGREALVADGVDATMDTEQPSLIEAALDPGPRMPEVQQLRA
jgi:hypothetical protein